jgi:DNA-binding transcriptional LysR family regulator
MLDGRDLRIIVTIAEHGSLVKAGRELGMSQSWTTRSLAQIEEKLGATLFERSRRGMDPTDIGRAILVQAQDVIGRLNALTDTVEALRAVRAQRLTIASAPMPLDAVVLPAVAACLDAFPETRFEVEATAFSEAADMVHDGRATLAVTDISELESPDLLEIIPLRRHPLLRWVRPGHPLLALGRPCSTAEVFRYPVALSATQVGRYSANFARVHRPELGFRSVLALSVNAKLTLATQSDAIAMATPGSAHSFYTAGLLVPLPSEKNWPASNFGVIHPKRRQLGAPAHGLVQRIKTADEAAFQLSQSLPPGILAHSPQGYAVAGARHLPATIEESGD